MRILPRLLIAGLVIAACTSEQPPTGPTTAGETATPSLPDDEDSFGKLPLEIGGFKVTRGATKGYVDDAACQDCHEEIYTSYMKIGMGRSFYPPDPKTAIEDFDKPYFHAKSGRYYVMTVRDGKYYQKRYYLDRGGKEYGVHEVEVKWVIGSGNHVRSYLSQDAYGELKELPLSWYTDDGWAMSPGYDAPDHPRFERDANRTCLFCHNGYPEMPAGADANHKPSVYPQTLPHGIGCQRCHGPGARHVEAAIDEDSDDATIRARIHNPKAAEELCMTCHLQPESMVGDIMPTRFGRNTFSHQPEESIRDHLFFLDHDLKNRGSRVEVNHHSYRMHQSKCYTQSEGRLRCTTCHDPHKTVPKEQRAAHYRQKCAMCHKLTDCKSRGMDDLEFARKTDCTGCHMQKARPMDVVHVTITDHRIGKPEELDRTRPLEESIIEQKPRKATVYFQEGQEQSDPRRRIYELLAFPMTATKAELAELASEFQAKGPHTAEGYVRVGRALFGAEGAKLALPILQEAAAKFPNDAHVQWALGVAWTKAREFPRAAMVLQKAHTLEPKQPDILTALGEALFEAKTFSRAEQALKKAYAIRPGNITTLQFYSDTLLALGKHADALPVLRELFARNPDDDYTARMIIACLHTLRRSDEAFAFMEQVSTHIHDLRLDLIIAYAFPGDDARKDTKRARELATEARTRRPQDPNSHLLTAVAQAAVGESHKSALEQARRLGADPAACTAVEILHHHVAGERGAADRLMQRFRKELQTPHEDPWRNAFGRAIQRLQAGR